MSIHVALHHRTRYGYDRAVNQAPHSVRLRPAPHCRTKILSYSLRVSPEQHFLNWQQDPFGNYLARLVFPEKATELLIEVDLTVEMAVYNPFDFFLEPSVEEFPFTYGSGLEKELRPFLEVQASGRRFNDFLRSIPVDKRKTIDFLVELNQRLAREIRYLIRLEPGVQTPEETLALGSGSCRDSGWLLVQLLRHLGLAARFVSGYLIQLKPDVESLDGPSGTDHDFCDLHAWCEVYLPGAGWIGLDPTSGLLAGEGHLPLACTPEPSSAAPVEGATDECKVTFTHEMETTRVWESPRVTKPYTEEQWGKILEMGRAVDVILKKEGVRLTMGGEPTFISIDNMDGEEWNFTAVGPEKRRLTDTLIRRLLGRFAPGGLLHLGQGKWYPGESLPRWAYSCYWRKDGQPIWHDVSLLADASSDLGHTPQDASRFIARLAAELGVDHAHIMPAYEDSWYYLWRERRLPVNIDPQMSELADKEERGRFSRVFDQGLGAVVGYALPLTAADGNGAQRWLSGPWFLRREHCFLVPGDSPMGLRLPLDSIPWVSQTDYPHIVPQDPSVEPKALPRTEIFRQALPRDASPADANAPYPLDGVRGARRPATPEGCRAPEPHESAPWIVRTALCVEPREGRLHVFLPPLARTEDYLRLVAAVEATSAQLRLPVVLEGERPPHDPRLNVFRVTPDPGVIEVNIPPVADWDQLVRNTEALYEEARVSRLGTEKFLMDGRHVGTGGGNHIVVGGETPADSPILRRPDLLRSLLGFWQNHPSLSFLFSSQFIGPTSQHPRVDEARNDSLYELEIAFRELDRQLAEGAFVTGGLEAGERKTAPWLVDRLFRNLLIDSTGNTHRAEFCIDKLYSPSESSGRLGLLELRAFEMPPHARMSITQSLLLRALLARFWKEPYHQPLVRWGTQLHDRFLLPFFVAQDFEDILYDLRRFGVELRPEWFAPHQEFRFPKWGEVVYRGVSLEVRQALEPWHVLGEQGHAGGMVRYVDSSLDRLQIRLRGLTDGRHAVTVNGRRVPLHPTGTAGDYVAGIRFRAWCPPECLHPTIGAHTPLTFDLVDTWNHRSLGGCMYHVSHPGGRNYTCLPVNAYEAESRRLTRFAPFGHTPGRVDAPPVQPSRELPFTLDLRHAT